MKAAFAVWNERIAPVFDVTRRVRVVESESGRILREEERDLPETPLAGKAIQLAELGVEELVCGAISRPLHAIVAAYGIRVIPFVAGDFQKIVDAWLAGRLWEGVSDMPGCRRRRGFRSWGVDAWENGDSAMNGKAENGRGMGGGGGQRGGGGQGSGRGSGQGRGRGKGSGTGGFCVCPRCGYREPHKRGVPCAERKCPECGNVLSRE